MYVYIYTYVYIYIYIYMCVYRSRRTKPALSRSSPRSYMKCVSIQKISGDEVDYTIIVLLPAEIMMCGKPDCQTSFKLEHISREIFPAASEKVALDVLWGARCREARERRERERERKRKREREKEKERGRRGSTRPSRCTTPYPIQRAIYGYMIQNRGWSIGKRTSSLGSRTRSKVDGSIVRKMDGKRDGKRT